MSDNIEYGGYMKDRLIELRRILNYKQGEFAKKLKMTQSALSNVENGINGLTDTNIQLICLTFGVNESWLKQGIGPIFNETPPQLTAQEAELLNTYRELSPEVQEVSRNNIKELLKMQKQLDEAGKKGKNT
jgi:transcriptional regulator with XRE-family HTH domain